MRVAVAGTFGPIHDGHRALFKRALAAGDDGVIVALTSDSLATETRHEPRPVPPFEERRREVTAELDQLDEWDRDIEVRKLTDPHGIASDDPSLDALVVSPETADEVETINENLIRSGLEPLEAIVVPFVRDETGERISSTRIVKGEIDEHGSLSE